MSIPKPQMTRIPPFRPGTWVKVRDLPDCPMSGKVLRVRHLTGALTIPGQNRVKWHVHFDNGLELEASAVDEIRAEGNR